ncbi:hypothetical protein AWB74_08107 [Caballeronia arvi]|uniref:DUF4935 domain-containing protein n=1 Tax=Caballeronia arvi TaxID=1777135 RepID=A0A158L320_9BURK|nr:PIN domain-containing protein [Caballeronia arvi]SAL87419.1 hypothetical protein AWB74_08107 [Caballeronia arvi]
MRKEDFGTREAAEWLASIGLFSALCVDTSVYDGLKGTFERGLLKQLEQFSDGAPIRLLMPDLVHDEVTRHSEERAVTSARALRKALKEAEFGLGLARDMQERIQAELLGEKKPEEVARSRLAEFLKRTGTVTLSPEGLVSVSELQRRYIVAQPPFAKSGEKKAEFPDAIALLSLEAWATENNTHIVVVSHDNDWKQFCAGSLRLHAVDDLAYAIGLFQHPAAAIRFAVTLQNWLDTDPDAKRVESYISDALWGLSITVDAASEYSFDEEVVDMELIDLELMDGHTTVTSANENEWTIEIQVKAQIRFEVYFSFSVRDGTDRDFVRVGQNTVDVIDNVDFNVLLTFLAPVGSAAPELEDVDVAAFNVRLDCGYVGLE